MTPITFNGLFLTSIKEQKSEHSVFELGAYSDPDE